MADIFLHMNNAQQGPYSEEQLQAWLRDGSVPPETLAWSEGMDGWYPLSAWPGMAPALARPVTQRTPYYRQPGAGYVPAPEDIGFTRLQYFGFGLLAKLLIWGLFFLAFALVNSKMDLRGHSKDIEGLQGVYAWVGIGFLLCVVLSLGIGIYFAVRRLQNIGWHGVLVLLMLLPVVNVFMAFCLLALPPGYARTKALDAAAWCWILFVLLFIGAVAVLFTSGMAAELLHRLGSGIHAHSS